MRKLWTESEDTLIKKEYPNNLTEIIAVKLNRSLRSVYSRANTLGLKKTEKYLNTEASGRLTKGQVIGFNTFFKKGQIPFNKGLKQKDFFSKEAIAKSKLTRFKKGRLPHNAKEDGLIMPRKDKSGKTYLYIRESLGVWKLYHRTVWEKHNGKLKRNEVVRFKDGNQTNCAIENLFVISMAENMKLNSIHQYPNDLKQVIKLTNKLKKQIIKTENHGKK